MVKPLTKALRQQEQIAAGPVPEFVRLEKNLMSLGFFTPSKSRGKGEMRSKTLRIKREYGNRIIEAEATIMPSVDLGLPTTADQDKYLAFQKIVADLRQQQDGLISNPVTFQSTQVLSILGLADSGKNFHDVYEWLERMAATTIRSSGSVYLAKRKIYARDIFHVFDRVVITGAELPDGRKADRNFVWLSDWQLENVNQNYLFPVDLETYRRLKNNIAKALVPLLQQWLYASRSDGRFEKRYEELCALLDLCRQRHLSDIQKQLGPSLEELQVCGYISNWKLDLTNDGREYKIVAYHGPKFFQDQRQKLPGKVNLEGDDSPALLQNLLDRGVAERQARKLLRNVPVEQPVMDQIEYADSIIGRGGISNPPGLYVQFIRENAPVPENFETSAKRRQREAERQEQRDRHWKQLQLQHAYEEYVRQQIERHIETLGRAEWDRLLSAGIRACRKTYPLVPQVELRRMAESAVWRELRGSVPVMDFQAFKSSAQLELFR